MSFSKIDLSIVAEGQFVGPALHQAAQNQAAGDTAAVRRSSLSWPVDARPVLWGLEVFAFRLGPVLISSRTSQLSCQFLGLVSGADAVLDLALVDGAGLQVASPQTTVSSGSGSWALTLDTSRRRGWYELVLLVRTERTATTKTADLTAGSGVIATATTIDLSGLGLSLSSSERYVVEWNDHSSSPASYVPGNYPAPRHLQWWRNGASPTPAAFPTSPTVAHLWPPLDTSELSFEGVNHGITITALGTVTLYSVAITETLTAYATDPRAGLRPGMPTSPSSAAEIQARALRHHLEQTTIEHRGVWLDRADADEFGNHPSRASRVVAYGATAQELTRAYFADRDRDQTTTTQQTGASAGTQTTTARTSYLVAATCLLITASGDEGLWALDLEWTANEFSGSPGFDWTDDTVSGSAQALGGEGFAAGLLRNRRLDTRRDLLALALHLAPSATGALGGADPAYQHLDGLIPASYLTRAEGVAGLRLFVLEVQDDPNDPALFRRLLLEALGQERSVEGVGVGGAGRAWLHVGPVAVYVAPQL